MFNSSGKNLKMELRVAHLMCWIVTPNSTFRTKNVNWNPDFNKDPSAGDAAYKTGNFDKVDEWNRMVTCLSFC